LQHVNSADWECFQQIRPKLLLLSDGSLSCLLRPGASEWSNHKVSALLQRWFVLSCQSFHQWTKLPIAKGGYLEIDNYLALIADFDAELDWSFRTSQLS
jgi:hypothetical protein